jgi:Ni/Co efflux regulator RcnB
MTPQTQGGPRVAQQSGGNASGRSAQGRSGFAVAPAPARQNRPAFAAAPTPVQQSQALAGRRQAFARQPARPANVQVLSGWNRAAAGPAQAQAGQQWRQAHSGWDSGARWRGNQNWWRGDAGFRLFGGERIGFFFIPELGYISAPAEYRSHHWRAGDQLPNWFWRYQVRDYWNYGLPEPPDGCAWVWVNNDVALIDTSDGYILDIDHNVW